MKNDKLLTWLKAGGALLGAAGIAIDPDQWEVITAGVFAVYGVISGVRAHFLKS